MGHLKHLALQFALLVGTYAPVSQAASCRAQAGDPIRPVVELFTSEGCSSCPPADRWLSSIARASPRQVIAIAYHVDYWDDIGWPDRFADPASGRLHQQRVDRAGGRVRYTPHVFVDGEEFPDWRRGTPPHSKGTAQLTATITHPPLVPGDPLRVAVTLDGKLPRVAVATLALVENGLISNIHAGENAGRTLRHDSVSRSLRNVPVGGQIGLQFETELPVPADIVASHSEILLILRDSAGRTLQAVTTADCDG